MEPTDLFVASCQYPGGLLDQEPAYASLRRLAGYVRARGRPGQFIVTGDQVYLDATAGLFDPTRDVDRYERPYLRLDRALQAAPIERFDHLLATFSVPDDHEFTNNLEPVPDAEGKRLADTIERGARAYFRHSPFVNRVLHPDDSRLWSDAGRIALRGGGPGATMARLPLFLSDCRTGRTPRPADGIAEASIMDQKVQWPALCKWFDLAARPEFDGLPKFFVSSSLMLPRRLAVAGSSNPASALLSDAWDGFPASQQAFLYEVARRRIKGLITFSGDEHMPIFTRASVRIDDAEPVQIHSLHAPPLYAPYPFGNASRADFAAEEVFEFRHDGHRVQVDVSAHFPAAGDGCIHVEIAPPTQDSGCVLSARVLRASGPMTGDESIRIDLGRGLTTFG